jgi:uncharacterized OsmC-like protein
MLGYQIKANSIKDGIATIDVNNGELHFDASTVRQDKLANPAELLLSSLAACMLKNVERFSKILKYEYLKAEIEVSGKRNDSPPFMSEVNYVLKIESEMTQHKLDLLHKNILKFGTITNTIAKATILNGKIEFLNHEH